ncbi:beta-lactamase family protein [Paenibacillus sp. GSMTC-2017]|uniref:serine hydrolase domain-containing protein n=1 Tax=Paenibacillus sp. GSMTC-2017 TaxID=2794350 RepID=UPI0018D64891|nr:serine hydrolase domain-containing protein [Paenibacillus sp. GSMTC-2017]MBH5318787.1 beta-lactamase family protein [Paenibacillus sp. GSMTC-2017]
MKTNILEPAGMHASSYLKQEIDTQLSGPHILSARDGYGPTVSEIFPYNRRHAPSSTLYANAEDMWKYALVHVNKGVGKDDHNIISPTSYTSMWQSTASTGYGAEMATIGLGWFLGEYKGSRIVSHSGMDTGFSSHLILLPDHGTAVSLMTNCDFIWLSRLSYMIIALLGESVSRITRSLVHHLTAIAIADGVDITMDQYTVITEQKSETYYIRESEIPFIADELTQSGCLYSTSTRHPSFP